MFGKVLKFKSNKKQKGIIVIFKNILCVLFLYVCVNFISYPCRLRNSVISSRSTHARVVLSTFDSRLQSPRILYTFLLSSELGCYKFVKCFEGKNDSLKLIQISLSLLKSYRTGLILNCTSFCIEKLVDVS